jgi:DNA-binding NtrC family response regulator
MSIRPSSFAASENAVRDPRGGSLDPALVVDAGGSTRIDGPSTFSNWVLGSSAAMRRIAKSIERAAEVECTVLVCGETGTGKELWARLLHRSGPRRNKAFIPVNCAALTPSLAESQLFGHEKGAFTGANGRSLGIFRAAAGGVVFLDEIGEMPMELQAKLLRVLQQREVLPVGANEPEPIDVQIVAATNRDLEKEVEKGNFREDLYYRLNMIELRVPSLRERAEDIPSYIEFFSQRFADRYRLPVWTPSADALAEFCSFNWPGNVRQLEHVIEQAYVLQMEPKIPVKRGVEGGSRLASDESSGKLPCLDLAKLREQAIREALQVTRGHKARAAKLLGVHANTMTRLLKEIDADIETETDGDESAA